MNLTKKEAELFISMLNDYSNRLSNDGCNDMHYPESWNEKEINNFAEKVNKSGDDFQDFQAHLNNYSVLVFYIKELKDHLKID